MERRTDDLLLNVIVLDVAVNSLQNLSCFIELSFAGKPPGCFWQESKNDTDGDDHCPLREGQQYDIANVVVID